MRLHIFSPTPNSHGDINQLFKISKKSHFFFGKVKFWLVFGSDMIITSELWRVQNNVSKRWYRKITQWRLALPTRPNNRNHEQCFSYHLRWLCCADSKSSSASSKHCSESSDSTRERSPPDDTSSMFLNPGIVSSSITFYNIMLPFLCLWRRIFWWAF